MISANTIERDMLLKFMESAQSILPGTTLLYAEKYQYEEDIYLRFGLDLPEEINSDSPDIEKVQRVASSLPVSPMYQLSIAFTPASDLEHELSLDFLPGKYISPKSRAKQAESKSSPNRLTVLLQNLFNRFRQNWPLYLLAFFVFGFLIWNNIERFMDHSTDEEKNYAAVISAMRDEPAHKKLKLAARDFRSALEEYRDAMYSKLNKGTVNKHQASDTANHLYDYIKAVEQDPLFNFYGDDPVKP